MMTSMEFRCRGQSCPNFQANAEESQGGCFSDLTSVDELIRIAACNRALEERQASVDAQGCPFEQPATARPGEAE
jgi:hypothetical protein